MPRGNNYDHEQQSRFNSGAGRYNNQQSNYDPGFIRAVAKVCLLLFSKQFFDKIYFRLLLNIIQNRIIHLHLLVHLIVLISDLIKVQVMNLFIKLLLVFNVHNISPHHHLHQSWVKFHIQIQIL